MKKKITKVLMMLCCIAVFASAMCVPLSASALAVDAIPTGTPVIDGNIDDIWEYASNKIDIKTVNLGSEKDNATGWARLMWDKDAIYVLGYASDKTVSTNITGDPWETDSFEFFLNEQNKQVSDFKWIDQFRTDRENRFSGMIAHIISTEAQYKRTFPGLEWASKTVEGSTDYVVEFKVPWKKVEVKAGSKIRIAFQINDDYNNDGVAEGEITNEVVATFNAGALAEMKLVSTKAEVPKNATSSKNETATGSTPTTQEGTQSKPTTASKTESATDKTQSATDKTESTTDKTESVTDNSVASDEMTDNTDSVVDESDGNENVTTTVKETVNQKLINTVIIASAAAVLLVAIICVTVIILANKKKN